MWHKYGKSIVRTDGDDTNLAAGYGKEMLAVVRNCVVVNTEQSSEAGIRHYNLLNKHVFK